MAKPPISTTQPVDYEPPQENPAGPTTYEWDFIAPEPAPALPDPEILKATSPVGLVDSGVNEQTVTTLKAGDPVPYVFGTTLVTPGIITMVQKAAGNIYVDLLLSTGECDYLAATIQGGERFDHTTSPQTVLPGWEFHPGLASATASPGIVAELGSYDTLNGICHVVARVNQYTSLDIKFILQGLKLFDPRPSPNTTAYSNNPALALARIFVDSGYTVDWDTVADAANYCDENVGGSPFAARWTLDLAAFARQPLSKWAHTLAQYCGGLHIDNRGGVIYLLADKPVTTSPQITHIITGADIQRPRTTRAGLRKVPQKVIVHYREEDGTTNSATAGTGTSGEIARLQMPGFQTYTMAKRFATEVLEKAARDKIHEHIAYDNALEPTVGELADITYAPHGLTAQRMRLIDYRQIEVGRWWRRYKEYSDAMYSDGIFTQPAVGTNPALDTLEDVPAGPTPTATQETYAAGNYDRLKITFSGSSWNHTLDYRVTVQGYDPSTSPRTATDVVLETLTPHLGTGTHTLYTTQLTAGNEYVVSVRTRSKDGKLGDATTSETTAFDSSALLTDLAAWWALEEASGTRLNSHAVASPNLYNLTEGGSVAQGTGKVSNSADFGADSPWGDVLYYDGTGTSPMDSLLTTQTLSTAFWVKFNSIPDPSTSVQMYMVSRGTWDTLVSDEFAVYITRNTSESPFSERIHMSVFGTGLNQNIAAVDATISTATWYFVYAFYNVTTKDFGLSVNDGTVYTSAVSPLDTDPIGNDDGFIKLGQFLNLATQHRNLDGELDEVAMWERQLTADEVSWLYNSGSGRTYTDI